MLAQQNERSDRDGAADMLLGLDPWGGNWITRFRNAQA